MKFKKGDEVVITNHLEYKDVNGMSGEIIDMDSHGALVRLYGKIPKRTSSRIHAKMRDANAMWFNYFNVEISKHPH